MMIYLSDLNQKMVSFFKAYYFYIVICASSTAIRILRIPVKLSDSYVGDLYGMIGTAVQIPMAPSGFSHFY